jgi:nucleoside-diphosphate-sugar epimerase
LIVAVTGSTGFIGSNLSNELYSRGHEVIHVDRTKEKVTKLFGPNSKFVSSDQECQAIRDNMEFFRPEILIHCSVFFTPSRDPGNLEEITQANVSNPIKIIEASRNQISKIVNLNSYWQIECSPTISTPYASTKEAFRTYLNLSMQSSGVKVHNLFIPETFGPGDRRGKIVQRMIESQRNGGNLKLIHPQKIIDLTYVPFLVQMLTDFVENRIELPDVFSYVNFPSIKLGDLMNIVEFSLTKEPRETHHSLIENSNPSSVFESLKAVPSNVLGKEKQDLLTHCLVAAADDDILGLKY